jgi:hypothetical protein
MSGDEPEITEDLKPQWTTDNPPKSKTEWDNLKSQDPILFADLTQGNFDRQFREKKELEGRLSTTEAQVNNLTAELDSYKQRDEAPPVVEPDLSQPVKYSINNLPKTKKEWEDLLIDDPVHGTDLRAEYNRRIASDKNNFTEAKATSQRTVQTEHPDMYLAELDESGQPKKDDTGNVVLKRDGSGAPLFNPSSEKGKLWLKLYNEDNVVGQSANGLPIRTLDTLADGPEILMERMQRHLRQKGVAMVDEASNQREQQVQDGQVVHEGVTPPAKVAVVFHSDEEQKHAQRMIDKGLYKDVEAYVTNRDKPDEGIYDENREPSFGGK